MMVTNGAGSANNATGQFNVQRKLLTGGAHKSELHARAQSVDPCERKKEVKIRPEHKGQNSAEVNQLHTRS